MKALLISEYGALNGGEFSFLAALPTLQKAGFAFTAALPASSDFAALLKKHNVEVVEFSFLGEDGTRKPQDEIRRQLASLIENIKPEIVHANSLAASRILGPVTEKLETIGLGYLRDIIKLSGKAIEDVGALDHIVAVSQATADFHIERGLPNAKVSVIHNGVDLNRFRPPDRRVDSDRPVCLCIGQIGMRKGLELSLGMLRRVFERIPEAELWIVGQRHSQKTEAIEYEATLHQIAEERFPRGSVKWLGRRTDVPQVMQRASLLVHAAKQEPLGRVLLEATASGLPMVTTNVGGTPEILQGMEEFMFSPHQFDDAAPVSVELLSNRQLHTETSVKLRAIAEQKFSSERAGSELAKRYCKLLN